MAVAAIPVVVTRPGGQAAGLVAGLTSLGCQVRHHPLIDIVPLADDERALASGLRQRILDIDHYSAVIAISMNAAAIGLDWLDRYWPQPPLGIHWCAVGPSTADVLQREGFRVHSPVTTYDSEGLLALPVMQSDVIGGHKVLIWRGVGGREKLAAVLSERGAQVDYAELYERREIAWSAPQWADTLAGEPVLLLSSNQALDIVEQQVPDLAQRVRAIMLPGERVAAVARRHGYREVLVAASARDEDMLACLQKWQASAQS
ncbi:MAG: uroporphyrinogen-III synthase [Saccharospirillaceae bacterium]|nr:uroporphyrinogen-III synthase [Saccharospirillaceae bacterium]MCD8531879.1 uroporphyrinogen-III synthase [Saccharospirillaceae bacterium]